ncbi:MAG: hypothetical protein MUO53_03135 [Maribacter sp.]|nr:hypothetical protein [Maribacter sp.]
MARTRNFWKWNLLAVLTVIICLLALLAHYKNWMKIKPDHMQILSGFYYKEIKYADLDSVLMVEKIPPMIRLNGFSALDKGKGIYKEFKDSLSDKKVNVFVDNFTQNKIKLVYKDSLLLYVNFKDSTQTNSLYQFLEAKMALLKKEE